MPRPETGRYRRDVDSGRTGDKVAHPDPAAAPLEADAESAGEATPRRLLDRVSRRQARIRRQRTGDGPTAARRAGRWGGAATVVLVAVGVLAGWLSLAGLR